MKFVIVHQCRISQFENLKTRRILVTTNPSLYDTRSEVVSWLLQN